MGKKTQPDDDLDDIKRAAADFLRKDCLRWIVRKEDSAEIRLRWLDEVAFAMVSGVLLKLARKYDDDLNKFFGYAMRHAEDLTFDDLTQHSEDFLPQRFERWVELLKRPPSAKSVSKLQKLQVQKLYEYAIQFIHNWQDRDKKAICAALQNEFSNLTFDECKKFADRIAAKKPIKKIALDLAASVRRIGSKTLDRHYLRGALTLGDKIDKALKIR